MRDQRVLRTRLVAQTLYVLLMLVCWLAGWSTPQASAQVKPYFLVIVDTSGSMSWCANGSSNQLGADDCSCYDNTNNQCTGPFKTNICGFPANKLGDAKCSLQRIIDGVGSDAVLALMQFEHPCSPSCTDSGNQSATMCDPSTSGADDAFDDGQLLADFDKLKPGNANVREWVDGACTGACSANDYKRELSAGWWTPIGKSLSRANEFLHGTASDGFLYPLGGDVKPDSPLVGDTALACRKVSVILLTDGTENCEGNPANEAARLLAGSGAAGTIGSKSISTYVIGFGTGGDFTPATLNAIATAGGTDAPPAGGDRYYAASDEAGLSAALSQIIASSLVVETCNSKDDDCDGKIDEDIPSGQPGADPQPQALFCDREGQRTDAQNTQVRMRPEYPNIARDAELGARVVCGRVKDTCAKPNEDDDCDGKLDEDAAPADLNNCGRCKGEPDTCDGVDNDCDGTIDNKPGRNVAFSACPLQCTVDVPCGSDIGACMHGHYVCTGGKLDMGTCVGQVGPSTEICDTIDNDCDGIVDNPSVLARKCQPGWGDVGICKRGTQYCAMASEMRDSDGFHLDQNGKPVCEGQVGPETLEQCDELDHDCDGNPLTCTGPTCLSPILKNVGDVCGQGVGTCQGTLFCDSTSMPPVLRCNAAGGMDEVCDGADNDCDGAVDEDLGPQGPCGSARGECRPGMYQCDMTLGKRVCIGGKGPSDELCDALDNDCDGKVDEGIGLGDVCGESEGICEPGKQVCQSGRVVCSGDMRAQPETCDCQDNDCDGKTDEDTGSTAICPGASVCTQCQCALPCAPTREFIAQCPQGKAPVTDNGQCYCVAERCNDDACAAKTIEQDSVLQCAPDSAQVGACICQNNACVSRCSGVSCGDGSVCDRTDGRCKVPSCLLPQFKCPDGQHCVKADAAFGCQDDPCANNTCAADEACRDGSCVKSCGNVHCQSGKRCVDGDCVTDLCAGKSCSLLPEMCDPTSGDCIAANGLCVLSSCTAGEVCNAISGDCNEDPCLRIQCPVAERCVPESGQCEQRCASGRVYCGGECINPKSDRQYCGASADCAGDNDGERCATGLVCSLGECSDHCAESLVNCSSTCIDPQTDNAHCGATDHCGGDNAGQLCTETQSCVRGRCRSQLPETSDTPAGLVATGGGGCSCRVAPGSQLGVRVHELSSRRLLVLSLGTWLCIMTLRLRRRRKVGSQAMTGSLPGPLVFLTLFAIVSMLAGCDTKAFIPQRNLDAGSISPFGEAGVIDSGDPVIHRHDGGKGGSGGGDAQAADAQVGSGDTCMAQELCNGKDDDCDGKIDEDADLQASHIDSQNDPLNCGGCGKACAITHAFNSCQAGQCVIDQNRGEQGCDIGFYDLDGNKDNGCEYSCTRTADDDKACDLVDNDCDGKIDENVDTQSDGSNCGNCGVLCEFAHASKGASCTAGKCALDSTKCDDGFRDVDGRPGTGCEYRCPSDIKDEICNALDDDCDGKTDEEISTASDATIGVACGNGMGECKQGTTVCQDGVATCTGQKGPTRESCDGKDNDCDGTVDNGFDVMTDKANCGSCGHACVLANGVVDGHAILVCAQGMCAIGQGGCLGNYSDFDHDWTNGCETACTFTSAEYCDGIDNDCNGLVDDNVQKPDVICSGREQGVCAGNLTELRSNGPQCMGGQLSCNLANVHITDIEVDETKCDGKDNDCDGRVDEMIPAIGMACSKGTGACMTSGHFVCDSAAQGGYRCDAADPGSGQPEACNGKDDDCNNTVDDLASPSPTVSVAGIELVNLGGDVLMMAYEASRPDATQTAEGSMTAKPCSAGDRLPWTNVTWAEANSACCSLNANGQCAGDQSGWRLCDATTWEDACSGGTGGRACTWAYNDSNICSHNAADDTHAELCMGAEAAEDSNQMLTCSAGAGQCATYAGRFTSCYADWGGAGKLFDLSGNVREWTYTQTSQSGVHEIRGGGYNNFESARTCSFDFNAGDASFHFPSTGFRCCYYP